MSDPVGPYRIPLSSFRLQFLEWAEEDAWEALASSDPERTAHHAGRSQAFRDAAAHLGPAIRQEEARRGKPARVDETDIDYHEQDSRDE